MREARGKGRRWVIYTQINALPPWMDVTHYHRGGGVSNGLAGKHSNNRSPTSRTYYAFAEPNQSIACVLPMLRQSQGQVGLDKGEISQPDKAQERWFNSK